MYRHGKKHSSSKAGPWSGSHSLCFSFLVHHIRCLVIIEPIQGDADLVFSA